MKYLDIDTDKVKPFIWHLPDGSQRKKKLGTHAAFIELNGLMYTPAEIAEMAGRSPADVQRKIINNDMPAEKYLRIYGKKN